MPPTLVDRLRQPEYTGENRCIPCTAVNVVIALLLAAATAVLSTLVGVAVLAVSLAAIALRGYLVPGTPALTKRYLPDSVLAKFDKAPAQPGAPTPSADAAASEESTAEPEATDAGGEAFVDPEEALRSAGAVELCEDVEDLCLTDSFAESWQAEMDRLREDRDAQRAAVTDFFGGTDNLLFYEDEDDGRFHAYDGNDELHVWVSRGALLSDLAAHEALGDREEWATIPPAQRLGIGRALRSFLPVCPICGGDVGMTEDTVESCCRSWEVVAVRCFDCDEHFLEINPQTMGVVENYGASVGGSGGPEGVGGGFTR
jgi:hypothetical protein